MNCISTHSPRKYAGLPIHSRSFLSCRYLICRCLRRGLFGSLVIPARAFLLAWFRPPSVGRAGRKLGWCFRACLGAPFFARLAERRVEIIARFVYGSDCVFGL